MRTLLYSHPHSANLLIRWRVALGIPAYRELKQLTKKEKNMKMPDRHKCIIKYKTTYILSYQPLYRPLNAHDDCCMQ